MFPSNLTAEFTTLHKHKDTQASIQIKRQRQNQFSLLKGICKSTDGVLPDLLVLLRWRQEYTFTSAGV